MRDYLCRFTYRLAENIGLANTHSHKAVADDFRHLDGIGNRRRINMLYDRCAKPMISVAPEYTASLHAAKPRPLAATIAQGQPRAMHHSGRNESGDW